MVRPFVGPSRGLLAMTESGRQAFVRSFLRDQIFTNALETE